MKLKEQIYNVIVDQAARNTGAVPAPMHVARMLGKDRTTVGLAYRQLVADGLLHQPYGAKCGYALHALPPAASLEQDK